MLREKQVGINLRYLRECEELEVEEMAPKLHLTPEALRVLESGDAAAAIPLLRVTRAIRACLKGVYFGAFRPFSLDGRQPACGKEKQKSLEISSL